MTTLRGNDEDVTDFSPIAGPSGNLKAREKMQTNFLERANEISNYEESFIKTKGQSDEHAMMQDGQRLTPPQTPKRKLLDQRITGVPERKRIFHDHDDAGTRTEKICQEVFNENQVREIEARGTKYGGSSRERNPSELEGGNTGKNFRKVDTEIGKCMFAYFTQTNEV